MSMPMPELVEESAPRTDPGPQVSTALACVLEYAPGAQIALPVQAGVELVEHPRFVPVPGMPHFCLGLVPWQGRQLPLLNLQAYLHEAAPSHRTSPLCTHMLVVAYQAASGQPIEYGALCAPFLVRMTEVADHQQCPLPTGQEHWLALATSCFLHQGQAVPVLDPARIFTRSVARGTI